jgi:hypothetical protein
MVVGDPQQCQPHRQARRPRGDELQLMRQTVPPCSVPPRRRPPRACCLSGNTYWKSTSDFHSKRAVLKTDVYSQAIAMELAAEAPQFRWPSGLHVRNPSIELARSSLADKDHEWLGQSSTGSLLTAPPAQVGKQHTPGAIRSEWRRNNSQQGVRGPGSTRRTAGGHARPRHDVGARRGLGVYRDFLGNPR